MGAEYVDAAIIERPETSGCETNLATEAQIGLPNWISYFIKEDAGLAIEKSVIAHGVNLAEDRECTFRGVIAAANLPERKIADAHNSLTCIKHHCSSPPIGYRGHDAPTEGVGLLGRFRFAFEKPDPCGALVAIANKAQLHHHVLTAEARSEKVDCFVTVVSHRSAPLNLLSDHHPNAEVDDEAEDHRKGDHECEDDRVCWGHDSTVASRWMRSAITTACVLFDAPSFPCATLKC